MVTANEEWLAMDGFPTPLPGRMMVFGRSLRGPSLRWPPANIRQPSGLVGQPRLGDFADMGSQIRHAFDQGVKILGIERQQFCLSPRGNAVPLLQSLQVLKDVF